MKIIVSRSAKQSCSWFFYHLPHNNKLPTSSDSVSCCFSFCIVNPVLVRTHSNSLSTASSRLDRLWYHRETTACSSNDKRWLEKKHWYCHHTASEIFQLQTWLWFGHKLKEKVSGNICYSLTGTQHLSAPPCFPTTTWSRQSSEHPGSLHSVLPWHKSPAAAAVCQWEEQPRDKWPGEHKPLMRPEGCHMNTCKESNRQNLYYLEVLINSFISPGALKMCVLWSFPGKCTICFPKWFKVT